MMQTVRIPRGRLNMFSQMTFKLDIRPFFDWGRLQCQHAPEIIEPQCPLVS